MRHYCAGTVTLNESTVLGAPIAIEMFDRFRSAPEVATEPSIRARYGAALIAAPVSTAEATKRNQPAVPTAMPLKLHT